jgi:transcriptional regulator with XRE-family HTH domain
MEELRQQFRAKLEAEGLTLRRAEALCGVSFATLSRFMRGADLLASTSEKIKGWIAGTELPKPKPVSVKRMKVGSKVFIVTIEQVI